MQSDVIASWYSIISTVVLIGVGSKQRAPLSGYGSHQEHITVCVSLCLANFLCTK